MCVEGVVFCVCGGGGHKVQHPIGVHQFGFGEYIPLEKKQLMVAGQEKGQE